MKLYLIPFIAVAALVGGFYGGIYYQQTQVPAVPPQEILNPELGKPAGVDFGLFWQTWNTLKERYVDRDKLDANALVYGAIKGMVESIGDPYTAFLAPKETERFAEDIKGEFGGIGIEIGLRNNTLTVISPIEGTPAYRAGLKAGDSILAIDQTATDDLTLDEAVNMIRGTKGSQVVLKINREEFDSPRDFSITRDTIKIPTVTSKILEDNIVHIRLHTFNQNAATQLRKNIQEARKLGAEKLLLDLRNNPGGLLDLAIEISGWFLETGKTVVIEDFGDRRNELQSSGRSLFNDMPMVILINRGSASASEIVAGALQDHGRATVIGEKSFGKGSVQQLEPLNDNASLKVTVAKWLTPKGRSITEEGIQPDVLVNIPKEPSDAANPTEDPILQKGIEVLKNVK